MAKFCGKCGSRLDEITGLCPQCNREVNAFVAGSAALNYNNEEKLTKKERKRRKKQEQLAAMTFGQKVKRFFLRLLGWLLVLGILGAAITGGLVYLNVIDIPVVEDVIQEFAVILHKEHKWINATCTVPKTCVICGETEGTPLGHLWIAGNCVEAQTCSVCGEIGKNADGHDWIDATCTEPKRCRVCNETGGSATGHIWIEASYDAPKTCEICGETDGDPLKPESIYLVDMDFSDKYGKLWTWTEQVLDFFTHSEHNETAYSDMDTLGHTAGRVYDHLGNRYTNGLCVDLWGPASTYYITYDLDGKYTTFTGVCSLIEGMKETTSSKYFEIYCDGKLVFTSKTMTRNSSAQEFSIDVTGVKTLRIQYPPTKGQNRIATLFDGKLS